MIGHVLEALRHRWYIAVPSLLLAAGLAVTTWMLVPPTHERTASQLLVPGAGTVPIDGNPYFYLGGLTQAADVVVRAVGSNNVKAEIDRSFEGVEIEVARDPSTAGPVIIITVNAQTDADAAAVVAQLVARTKVVLEDLQVADNVAPSDRILVQPISIDRQGTVRQRTRIVATAAVGAGVAVLGLLLAALVDGLATRRRRRATDHLDGQPVADESAAPPDAGDGTPAAGGDADDPRRSVRRSRRVRASHGHVADEPVPAEPLRGPESADGGLAEAPVGAGRT